MYKIKNCLSPLYLTNLIHIPPKSGLRSSSLSHFRVFTIKHSFAKRSFSYSGPYLWNSLPSSLTNSTSLTAFRRGLKTYLFNKFTTERY